MQMTKDHLKCDLIDSIDALLHGVLHGDDEYSDIDLNYDDDDDDVQQLPQRGMHLPLLHLLTHTTHADRHHHPHH